MTVALSLFIVLQNHLVTCELSRIRETLANTTAVDPTSLISPSPSPSFTSPTTTAASSSSNTTSTSTVTSSLSSSSTSHTPTPTRIPNGGLSYVRKGCLYLNATAMKFTFGSSVHTNLSHLDVVYKKHNDTVDGCGTKRNRSFTRKYFDSEKSTKVQFLFKLSFEYGTQDDSWSLSSLYCVNMSHNSSYSYGSCGYDISFPYGMYYKCPLLECNGHEGAGISSSNITIQNFIAEVLRDGHSTLSKDYLKCGKPFSGNNSMAFLIVGLVIGITLTIAIITIIASFLYKRYRYGPYNLLD